MAQRTTIATFFTRIAPTLLAAVAVGCGGGDGTYRVSGKVNFKGAPVPAGKVYFIPDASKGNSGPTGFADIKNGTYDTGKGGSGAPPGPVIVAVEGIDPSAPPPPTKGEASADITTTLLFARYETPYEVPKSSSTKDIDVPESAAKGPVAPKQAPGMIIP